MINSKEKIGQAKIRRGFDDKSQKWFFSVVDIIGVLTGSVDSRNYWKVLKNRLKKTNNDLVLKCKPEKMVASDGKFYFTDTADDETMLEIIKIVSEENVLPFRMWFDELEQKGVRSFDIKAGILADSPMVEEDYPPEELMLMVDGYYEGDLIVIKAFLAGVDIDNVIISVTCDSITIKGERKKLKGSYTEEYMCEELYWGKFSRTIKLQKEIEINQSIATANHGLLTIKLPTIDKTRSKLLKVRSN